MNYNEAHAAVDRYLAVLAEEAKARDLPVYPYQVGAMSVVLAEALRNPLSAADHMASREVREVPA